MRILTVASEVAPVRSGVARSVQHIVDGARAAGHEVAVRSYADARLLERDQVRLSTLGAALHRSEIGRHDILHLHGPAPSVSDVLLLRRRLGVDRTPIIYTHHFTVAGESGWLTPAYELYGRVAGWLAQAASVIVTTSDSYAAIIGTAGGPPVRVLPWATELPVGPARSLTDHATPLRVLVVGQMRRYKGHRVAIDAVVDRPEIELTLAGDGPLADELTALAATMPNATIVRAPTDAEILDLYRQHDVVVLPATNRSEAFGIVLLEAMMQGCVPVASDLPGVSDVAGPTGVLVAPRDPQQLGAALRDLANDRPRVLRLSEASMRRAQEYSWAQTVAGYLDIYDEVHAGSRPSSES